MYYLHCFFIILLTNLILCDMLLLVADVFGFPDCSTNIDGYMACLSALRVLAGESSAIKTAFHWRPYGRSRQHVKSVGWNAVFLLDIYFVLCYYIIKRYYLLATSLS